MNLHLNRRLEVLAREITEAKKPRINTEDSRLFAEAAKQPYAKTLGDLKGARAEAGAGRVGYSSPAYASPSVQKFKVGQKWLCRNGTVATVLEVSEGSGFGRAENGYRDLSGRITTGLDSPSDFIELISPAPETETEGWLTWAGGTCPVSASAVVDTRSRDPEAEPRHRQRAGDISADRWSHDGVEKGGSQYEIVAYRVVKP